MRDLYDVEARARVARAIGEIEAGTSAEIVVALRPNSGHYRHADYLAGFCCALASLVVFLFHPLPMRVDLYVLEFIAAFVVGSALSALTPPLRRLLISRGLLSANVERAARAAFVELGVSRTRARSGVLVYLSVFERRAVVVTDIGVEPDALGEPWREAIASLDAAMTRSPATEPLLAALSALGGALALALPRAPDDVDELPNAMSA
jgi:putative membrane protein